jgi:MFS family permease
MSETDTNAPAPRQGGMAAFRYRDYTYYWAARITGIIAMEMLITAVGWQVYNLTGRELDLGLVGLAQFAPFALLFLVSGVVADRFSRVKIMLACVILQVICSTVFFALTAIEATTFGLIFLILIFLGIARAFQAPAQQAVVPTLVPKNVYANAVAWTSSGFQMARIMGPALAGLLIAVGDALDYHEATVYGPAAALFLISAVLTFLIRTKKQIKSTAPVSMHTLLAGIKFIWRNQIILGAIGLDLFAVLLGGAVALLPIYAKDILEVGAQGFGVLRASFMFGSFICALYLTQRPVRRHAGVKLLSTVGIFGAGVIVFGISEIFWLSVSALFVMGMADAISVFIRQNLVQLSTPDDMRGRVSAVNAVFIGASNELGEFESGVTAHWWGVVPAVVAGGVGTIIVAIAFARLFPKLRKVDGLDPDELLAISEAPPRRRP